MAWVQVLWVKPWVALWVKPWVVPWVARWLELWQVKLVELVLAVQWAVWTEWAAQEEKWVVWKEWEVLMAQVA